MFNIISMWQTAVYWKIACINPLQPVVAFLYPLETSEKQNQVVMGQGLANLTFDLTHLDTIR